MGFRLVVGAVVVAHFAYLGFAVFGGLLAWRWPRLIWLHLAGAGWLLLVVVARLPCPLTWVEDRARGRAGMPPLPNGFIDRYVEGVFYPAGQAGAAQLVVASVVVATWAGFVVRTRRRQVTPAP
ncbi:MAG TPA: DUF2784 domain-containing protein [Actinoplanes sp.]|nr:DUF2784 domain-containing protein [Actinoplanes sp.]